MAYSFADVRALCVKDLHLEVPLSLYFLFHGDAAAVVEAH